MLLEKQISDKDKDILYYRDTKNWPVTSKQLIKEKDGLVKKLISLKEQQANGKNIDLSNLEKYKMYGKAFFRILLLLISALVTKRIFSF